MQEEAVPPTGSQRPVVDPDTLTYPALGAVQIPDVRRVELPNGLVVLLAEDRSLPLVQAQARIGAGSLFEPAEKVGLASVAASVMRTGGAGDLSPDEVNQALENVGASVEVFSGDETTTVSMRTLGDNLDAVLPVFADVLMRPAFAEDKVGLAKTQRRTAISRRNDNPQQIAQRELSLQVYGEDSPWARIPQYWTIDAIQPEDLRQWHETYFVPNNTLMAVWGDFDAADMERRLRDAFAGWERDADFEAPALPPVPERDAREVYFVPKTDVTQSTVLIAHPGELTLDHPDYPAVVVMNEILGGGFSSRLFQTIRTDLGYAYAVFGSYGADYQRPSLFFSGTFTKSGSTIAAADAMLEVIESMKTEPPTDDELQLAKDSYLNSFVFNFDTKSEVLGRLLTYEANDYPADFLQTLQERIGAVTGEEVQRVAQTYLHPDQADILVLGNSDDFDEPVSALGMTPDTLDITIPAAPPGEGIAVQGDATAGQVLLNRVLEAHGGGEALRGIETLQTVVSTTVETPQGAVEVNADVIMEAPDRFVWEQQLPQGTLTFTLNGEQGQIATPQGTQGLPSAAVGQLRQQLYSSLLPVLLALAPDADVEQLDDEDGLDVLSVQLSGAEQPVRLLVNGDGTVARMEGTRMTQQGPSQYETEVGDYRQVGQLMMPYRYAEGTEGEAGSSVTIVSEIEINPSVENGLFEVDG